MGGIQSILVAAANSNFGPVGTPSAVGRQDPNGWSSAAVRA